MNSFQAERWRRWIRAPVRLRGEMMRPAACAKAEAAYNLIRPGRPLNSEARENFRRIAPTPSPSLQAAFFECPGTRPAPSCALQGSRRSADGAGECARRGADRANAAGRAERARCATGTVRQRIWSEPHAATAQSSDTGTVEQLESCRAVGILSQIMKATKQVSRW
jgi:hypothetical protein